MKYMKFLLILFLLPLSVFADEDEMKIKFECPDEIKVKEQFSCQIKGLTDNLVSGIEYEFKLPSNLKFVSFEKDNSWEGDEENNLIILYGLEDKTQEFNIGKIVLIANEEIGSTTDTVVRDLIKEDIQNKNLTTIYYSSNPNANKNLDDISNGWVEGGIGLTEIKSYLIVTKYKIHIKNSTIKFMLNQV